MSVIIWMFTMTLTPDVVGSSWVSGLGGFCLPPAPIVYDVVPYDTVLVYK